MDASIIDALANHGVGCAGMVILAIIHLNSIRRVCDSFDKTNERRNQDMDKIVDRHNQDMDKIVEALDQTRPRHRDEFYA